NLEIEAGAPSAAPGDPLAVGAPEDDAEEGPVPAQIDLRATDVGDLERREAVRGGGREPVGDAIAHRRRPEITSTAESRERSLRSACEPEHPRAAVVRVREHKRA